MTGQVRPYAGGSCHIPPAALSVIARSLELTPPRSVPACGMMTSATRDCTVLPNAQSITVPTAMSTTMPRMSNAPSPLIMPAVPPGPVRWFSTPVSDKVLSAQVPFFPPCPSAGKLSRADPITPRKPDRSCGWFMCCRSPSSLHSFTCTLQQPSGSFVKAAISCSQTSDFLPVESSGSNTDAMKRRS